MLKFKLLTAPSKQLKMDKSNKDSGVMIFSLLLAPAKSSGFEVCKGRSKGCTQGCVRYANNGMFKNVIAAGVRRTKLLFEDRAEFERQLRHDLDLVKLTEKHYNVQVRVRLNCFSDLDWYGMFPWLADVGLQFYDYTKIGRRFESVASNYNLTFSLDERRSSLQNARRLYKNGASVAIPVAKKGKLKEQILRAFRGIVDGDANDDRTQDKNKIVVLGEKIGKAKDKSNGFIIKDMETFKRKYYNIIGRGPKGVDL